MENVFTNSNRNSIVENILGGVKVNEKKTVYPTHPNT